MGVVLTYGDQSKIETAKFMHTNTGLIIPKFIVVRSTDDDYFGAEVMRIQGNLDPNNPPIYNLWQAIIQPTGEPEQEFTIVEQWLVGQTSDYPNLDTLALAIDMLQNGQPSDIRVINLAKVEYNEEEQDDRPVIKVGRADCFLMEFDY